MNRITELMENPVRRPVLLVLSAPGRRGWRTTVLAACPHRGVGSMCKACWDWIKAGSIPQGKSKPDLPSGNSGGKEVIGHEREPRKERA